MSPFVVARHILFEKFLSSCKKLYIIPVIISYIKYIKKREEITYKPHSHVKKNNYGYKNLKFMDVLVLYVPQYIEILLIYLTFLFYIFIFFFCEIYIYFYTFCFYVQMNFSHHYYMIIINNNIIIQQQPIFDTDKKYLFASFLN